MAALKKKDDDMRAMEERYKMYLEKARNVSSYYFVFKFYLPKGKWFYPTPIENCPFFPT